MHGRNCFIFWRIFLPGGIRGAFTLQGLLVTAGRARSLQVRNATSVLVGRCEGKPALAPTAPTRLELDLQTDLDGPSISGTDERVPGHDIRGADCGAESRRRRRVIVSSAGAIRRPVRILNDGVIEHIEDLGTELNAISLLEREVLEDRQIHVPEA